VSLRRLTMALRMMSSSRSQSPCLQWRMKPSSICGLLENATHSIPKSRLNCEDLSTRVPKNSATSVKSDHNSPIISHPSFCDGPVTLIKSGWCKYGPAPLRTSVRDLAWPCVPSRRPAQERYHLGFRHFFFNTQACRKITSWCAVVSGPHHQWYQNK
jgi:hypothetical protein